MFRFEGIIDDKHVAGLLRYFAQVKAYNVDIKPVTNAKKSNGGVSEIASGAMSDRLTHYLSDLKAGSLVTTKELNDAVRELGGVPTSGNIRKLVANKVIKPGKSRGQFIKLAGK